MSTDSTALVEAGPGRSRAARAREPTDSRRAAGARRAWLRVAAAMVVLGWGGNQFLPLMALYRDEVGYSQLDVDLFLAFYVLGLVPGFVLASSLSDRYGRKPIIVAGLLISIAGSASLAAGGATMFWMCCGRMLSGIGVSAAMVAGSTWIKQLAEIEGVGPRGARRASLALSIGFGGGAGVAGLLAQYVVMPTVIPFAIHIVSCVLAVILLTRVANIGTTAARSSQSMRLSSDSARSFWLRVAPIAPWIFGAAALSFALGPSLVRSQLGSSQVVFATGVTVLTLGVGTAVQFCYPSLDRALRGRSGVFGAICVSAGAGVLVIADHLDAPMLVLVAAPIFGCGYGLCLVAGLTITQELARAETLAALTAVFYALSYAGFFLPLLFAALSPVLTTADALLCTIAAIVVCASVAAWSSWVSR